MSECLTKNRPSDNAAVAGTLCAPSLLDAECVAVRDRPFYYGWIMLPISMAALIASSPGQTFGVSILNEPMRASLGQLTAIQVQRSSY
jgi:hypothetical protein